MKLPDLKLDSVQAWALLIGLGIAGYAAYRVYKTGSAIGATVAETVGDVVENVKEVITEDLNPASDKNIIYDSISGAISDIRGEDSTLGTAIYDLLHPVSYTEDNAGRIDTAPQEYSPESYSPTLGVSP